MRAVRYEPGVVFECDLLPRALSPPHASEALRIVYQGAGYDGKARRVGGSVFLPATDPPEGGWPVVGYAHGTTGLSARCAPSRTGLTRLEREHVDRWLAAGHVVAATDYEGLDALGPHPYFNGEAVADDVIDVVRAARRLDDRVGRSWHVVGFSQGGHAALFTGLLATRYAPELDFRGTVAMAPPVHLPTLIAVVTEDGGRPVSVFLPFLLAGLRTSHPGFDARPFLTARGARLVDVATSATLVDLFRAIGGLTNDGMGSTDFSHRPGVLPILQACRVPVTRMDRPVFVTAGTADEIVPVEVVEQFVTDLEAAGNDVRYHGFSGASHVDVLTAGHDELLTWTKDRAPATSPARLGPFDANGDGELTRDDYEVYALRLAQAFGQPPGSPAAAAVRDGYRALWRAVSTRSDTDADGTVTTAELTAWLGTATKDTGFDRDIRPLADAVLALADTDHDGELTEPELTHLLHACDLPATAVRAEFAALDRDRDGRVSTDDLVTVIRDFCHDPARGKPGHWLFGRA
jgi:pimeloyl-ACP methyl ester carboxylesterase